MKIALVNLIKPVYGSGDGLTEYAYQLYLELQKIPGVTVDLVYSSERLKRNDTKGLIRANTLFRWRVRELAKRDYDIVHITHNELGFVAKVLKQNGSRAKIVTTIYDMTRFMQNMHHKGLQQLYNLLVKRNIADGVKYSDFIIYGVDQTELDVRSRFPNVGPGRYVAPGNREVLLKTPSTRKDHKWPFNIGYLGALTVHKNARFVVKSADFLKDPAYTYSIYGSGVEKEYMLNYIREHGLKNVELKGFAPEDRIVEIYDSFDVFVFPSLYEGFGYPPIEALCRGVPVVILREGKGIVPKDAERYFFMASTPEKLAATIRGLKEKGYDPKLKAAATKYARSLTWKNCAEDTYSIYKELLSTP